MLLIARASQDEILAAFAPLPVPDDSARMWRVGPTAPNGWTAAWVEEEAALPGSWDRVVLGEVGDPRVVRVRAGGAEQRFVWDAHDGSIPAEAPAAIAATLRMPEVAEPFRLALEEHLLGETTAEEELALSQVAEAVNGEESGLPELEDLTERDVLLDRGDAERRRRLAEEFARDDRGWVLTEIGGDWFTVHDPDAPGLGPGALDVGSAPGTDRPVLQLSRGGGSGVVLEDRDDLLEAIHWNSVWVGQFDDTAERSAACDALAAAFGPVAGQQQLRELCGAHDVDGDPLAQLLELLNIPRTALLVLDGDPSAPEPMVVDAPGGMLGGLKRLFGGRR
ncbi:hypothetical protein [Brachybacterium sp.]|uniref:hypothetical protein n=1 Tax=Brachybacterium sp. TaxID=1891286 RepID=UPI002ED611AF